ncbi:reverse transcriptase zinc-binding domain-containing protein [Tanacetum coccineum]
MSDKWLKVVWYSQCSPKQAIILWMAIQRKLMTQDRMIWTQTDSLKCFLCSRCNDSHDHLFFDCNFSKMVWGKIKVKGKLGTGSCNLFYLVRHLSANPHKKSAERTEDNLYDVIVGNKTDMLKCLRVRQSKEVLNIAKQWNLKWEKEKLIAEI